ncbi:hypothetical protein C1H76_3875 [Elsinoe australis]|uniref:Uncharacterized protein n=1 Tax=Elsinoe australis TaxID=40998 RepID=A0A4U7B8M0_9PEZI|nr:hypothetical protein C1H76_3875 [Elsinoe australis]
MCRYHRVIYKKCMCTRDQIESCHRARTRGQRCEGQMQCASLIMKRRRCAACHEARKEKKAKKKSKSKSKSKKGKGKKDDSDSSSSSEDEGELPMPPPPGFGPPPPGGGPGGPIIMGTSMMGR